MSRRLLGAVWPLPALLALLSAGGAVNGPILVVFAAGAVALAALPVIWWRLLARLGWLALFLGLGVGLAPHSLGPAVADLFRHLGRGSWGALSPGAATVLFEGAATVLVAVEEAPAGLGVRLLELLVNVAALALAKEIGGHVVWALFVTLALWLPLRRADLTAHRGGQNWPWAAVAVTALILVTLFASPSPQALGALAGGRGPAATEFRVRRLSEQPVLSHAVLFTAQGALPLYWSLYTDAYYTGQGWTNNLPPPAAYPPAPPPEQPATFYPNAEALLGISQPHLTVQETVHVLAPLPYAPVQGKPVDVAGTPDWFWYPQQHAAGGLGNAYTVTVQVPETSAAALLADGGPSPSGSAKTSLYLQLPSTLPAQVSRLARQIVGKVHGGSYQDVLAIASYLKAHERYSLTYPSDGGQDFVYYFLFVSHQGDCTAFASALAVMARAVGIPSRFVVGFTAGQETGNLDVVRGTDAHTWVEVEIPHFGWLPFDPTPGFGISLPETGQSVPAFVASAAAAGTGLTPAAKPTKVVEIHPVLNAASGVVTSARGRPLPIAQTAMGLAVAVLLAWIGAGRLRRLRAVAWLARQPWRWEDTARQWLGAGAPRLAEWVEMTLYAPAGTARPAFGPARQDLRRFLGGRLPWAGWLAYLI